MTEQEWLTSESSDLMLQALGRGRDDRDTRLFLCACCRYLPVWSLLTDERSRRAVEVAELLADGVKADDWVAADIDSEAVCELNPGSIWNEAAWMATWTLFEDVEIARSHTEATRDKRLPRDVQANLLREIVGNPIRLRSSGQPWGRLLCESSPTIARLAESAYESRDWELLPILADALEDAGCTDEMMLRHFRGEEFIADDVGLWRICEKCNTPFSWGSAAIPRTGKGQVGCPACGSDRYRKARNYIPMRSQHVRGCWALDLILGKE